MRLYKSLSYFLMVWVFCSVTSTAAAKEIQVSVHLVGIKAIKTEEANGDELYLHVTQYSSLGKTNEKRVPIFPTHWPSKDLDKVKDVVVWEGPLKNMESVKLIISLLEQDNLAVSEMDNLIGGAELDLTNENSQFKKEWKVPIYEKEDEVEMLRSGDPQRFLFKGLGAKYEVLFKIVQKID